MLRYRLITGPLLILSLLALVTLSDWVDSRQLNCFWKELFRDKEYAPRGLVMFMLTLGLAPLAARELSAIFRANEISTRTWLTTLAVVTGLVLSYSIPTRTATTLFIPPRQ